MRGPAVLSPRLPVMPPGSAARRARDAAIIAAVIAAELVVGVASTDARFLPIVALVAGLLVLALVFRTPFGAACGLLVVTASVLQPAAYKVPVGPTELRLEELALGALLVVAIVRPQRRTIGGPAGVALLCVFGLILLSGVVAIASGRADAANVVAIIRPLTLLGVFFVVVRLFPDRVSVFRLLIAAVAVAALSGLIALLSAAPGSPLEEILNDPAELTINSSDGFGILNRVRFPAVQVAYVLFWFTAVMVAVRYAGRRGLWTLALAAMSVSIVLSMNRNMWVGVVLGFVLLLVLARQVRGHMLVASLAFAGIVLVAALSSVSVRSDSAIAPLVERATTLVEPGTTAQENALTERALENRYALAAIGENPLLGVGPGAPFGLRTGDRVVGTNTIIRRDELTVHNQYLQLPLMGGVPALLAFLVFLGAIIRRGLVARRDPYVAALIVGVIALAISGVVTQAFTSVNGAMILGLVCGAIVVLVPSGRRRDASA